MVQRVRSAAVIAAHPDDETLWAGGMMLNYPQWEWFVACTCRKNDNNRAAKFYQALDIYNAKGAMADLDDEPEQLPLDSYLLRQTILSLLPQTRFDIIITHSLNGEYTRHRRHEEVGTAVLDLWQSQHIETDELWMFAYEDGNRDYLPRAIPRAHRTFQIPKPLFAEKYRIITGVYLFAPDSFEAKTTPRVEAFWCFRHPEEARDTFAHL